MFPNFIYKKYYYIKKYKKISKKKKTIFVKKQFLYSFCAVKNIFVYYKNFIYQ
ncbi:hypothetical protein CCUN_1313 [Campylobacter cuniculorum DSM 23162 = LMG 24588]|uniref:Uncharacterized protein n=1 Tax=Campylobacter cuniculorum DSM 23162 = LMG 24588 TaxID=1121267 RepID=A0A1W6BXV2_9BACT|nr:hypothetical protein CCUN_1313 [Campylobacter cuniculorum DSM 23162 = LMG 24588]